METKQTTATLDVANIKAGFSSVLEPYPSIKESQQLLSLEEAVKVANRLLKTNRYNYRDSILIRFNPSEPYRLEVIATNTYAWLGITVRNTVDVYREKETFFRYENGQFVETKANKDTEVILYKERVKRSEFIVFEADKNALNKKNDYLDLFEYKNLLFINHCLVAEFKGETMPIQRHYNTKYIAPILTSLSQKVNIGVSKDDMYTILFIEDKQKRILFFICSCINPYFQKEVAKISK